jgi:hypothetical protein
MYLRIIILFLIFLFSNQDPLYNRDKRPSTYGIETYIENNQENLISEYEYKVDSLYDIFLFTQNLSIYSDGDLGQFVTPNEIIITNEEKYIAYEFKDLSKIKRKLSLYTDRTVKAVVFHELTHALIYKTSIKMSHKSKRASLEYTRYIMLTDSVSQFGARFIEEGTCEYAIYYLKESSPLENIIIPKNETELLDENKIENNLYQYSVYFLKDFLDKYGMKDGIEILISNKPPNYEEMLKPELFFKRLNYI